MVAQLMLPYHDGWELSNLRKEKGTIANVLLTQQWDALSGDSMFEEARISALPVRAVHLERQVRSALITIEN